MIIYSVSKYNATQYIRYSIASITFKKMQIFFLQLRIEHKHRNYNCKILIKTIIYSFLF